MLAVTTLLAGLAGTAMAAKRYIRYSGTADLTASGMDGQYRLRVSYLAPETWRTTNRTSHAITRNFGPIGSCRIRIKVTAAVVVDDPEDAGARVARRLPASGRYVLDSGTRSNAAWRVVRVRGRSDVRALLVRPAPSVKTQPAGRRVWLELRATGAADPKVECHSGGPRTTGAELGTALASATVGGFQFKD